MSVAELPEIFSPSQTESRPLSESILTRIASRDATAVEECLDRYGGLVWSLAKKFCGSAADAEDATQEIFLEVWQKATTYKPEIASEATFITMIARRRLIDRIRRESRKPESFGMSTESLEVAELPSPDRVELSDEAAKAARCIEKLSNEQQTVITLTIHHGHSHSSIAERLNMPLGTVKSYARRALLQLRDCMSRSTVSSAGGSLI